MVSLIFVLDIVENLEGLFGGGRLDHHFLETTLQCAIFLDILAVFVKGGGSDALDFTACESRFEQIGRIHLSG